MESINRDDNENAKNCNTNQILDFQMNEKNDGKTTIKKAENSVNNARMFTEPDNKKEGNCSNQFENIHPFKENTHQNKNVNNNKIANQFKHTKIDENIGVITK